MNLMNTMILYYIALKCFRIFFGGIAIFVGKYNVLKNKKLFTNIVNPCIIIVEIKIFVNLCIAYLKD